MSKKTANIKIYFSDDAGKKVFERIENISKRTGLSVSKVAGMAVRFGITEVEDRILEPHEIESKSKTKK